MGWYANITKRRAAHVVTHLGDQLQRPDFAHKTLFISGEQPREAGGIEALVSRMGLEGVEILWLDEEKRHRTDYFLLEAHNPSVAHTIFQETSREWEDNEGYFNEYHLQFGVFDSLMKGEILNIFLKKGWCSFWEMLNRPSAQSDEFIYEIGGELGVSEITKEQETTEMIYSGDKIPEAFMALIEPSNPDCTMGAIDCNTTVSKRRAYAIVSKLGDLLQSQEIPNKTLYVYVETAGHHEYWFRETLRTTPGIEVLWTKRCFITYLPRPRRGLFFLLRLHNQNSAIGIFRALQNIYRVGYRVLDSRTDELRGSSCADGDVSFAFSKNSFSYEINNNLEESVFCGEEAPVALREAVRLWP